MSGIVNKVKEALHSDKGHDTTPSTTHNTSGAPEGTYGPHGSRVANAADPRVDSDRDGSHNVGAVGGQRTAGHGEYGSTTGGYMQGGTGPTYASNNTGLAASTGSAGPGQYAGMREGEHGPHGSRMANALDPRVDSDRDGSRNAGAAYNTAPGTTGGTFGSSGYAGTQGVNTGTSSYPVGSTGNTGLTAGSNAGTREGEYGPHSSRTANALDPRVDSDRDASRNAGAAYNTGAGAGNTFGTGMGGAGYTSSTTGTNVAATGLGQSGPGPAPNTAGPHKSDMINKLDPRVDSNLDGSKTVGGNKTYQ